MKKKEFFYFENIKSLNIIFFFRLVNIRQDLLFF